MTPETHEQQQHAVPNPIPYLIFTYLVMLMVLTPIVALAWNLGLEPSGIAEDTIDWTTAVGLALAVLIARSIMAGARSSTLLLNR